jgi:hypothetical protein
MYFKELYCGQDGHLYAIERLLKNPMFVTYRKLSREELSELTNLILNDPKRESKAGSIGGKPASQQDSKDTTPRSSPGAMPHE